MPHQPYTVTLPEWEGPLDLLLHVIRSHELDILDIPIAFVTEQYLKYLDLMESLNLDVAAEYLEMAATLAYIKSRTLLPKPAPEDDEPEDEGDPREELIRRLLEYQRYKEAAQQLGSRAVLGRDTFTAAHPPEDPGDEPLIELGVFELVDAFRRILDRTKPDLAHEVTTERITVSERIGEVMDLLRAGELIPFDFLLGDEPTRIRLVVTLLALLEMTRLRMIRIFQAPGGGQIYASLRGTEQGLSRLGLEWPGAVPPRAARDRLRGRRPLPRPRTLQLLSRWARLPGRRGRTRQRCRLRNVTSSKRPGSRRTILRRSARRR